MKKTIVTLVALCAVTAVSAEEMKFVTMLSQPVASFAKLETLNQGATSKAFNLNFCNTSVPLGTIDVKGLSRMDQARAEANTTIGGNIQNYALNNIVMKPGGNITGGRALLARAGTTHIKSDDLLDYKAGGDLKTAAADLDGQLSYYEGGYETKVTNPRNLRNANMGWKNANHSCDYMVEPVVEVDKTVTYVNQGSGSGYTDTCDGDKVEAFTTSNYRDIPNQESCVDVYDNGARRRLVKATGGSAATTKSKCNPSGKTYTSYVLAGS